MWRPGPKDTTTIQLLHLKLNEDLGRGGRRIAEPEDQEVSSETALPRNNREATPTIPQQFGCFRRLNK